MVKKLSALEKPVYFRLLADNRTCQSDIPLFQIHKTSTSQTELCITWENGSSSPFASVTRNKPNEEQSADVCRVWHSEAAAPSLSSDQEWKLICRAMFTQLQPERTPSLRSPTKQTLDKPAINLLSFRSPVLFSPSALWSINQFF